MSRTRQSGSTTVWSLVLFATLALFAVTLYLIFVVAPVEKQMGIVQKIFYFHVPSAYAMYIGFGVSAVGKRQPIRDQAQLTGVDPVALVSLSTEAGKIAAHHDC